MKTIKLFLAALLLAVALFCGYGALASLEPTETSPIHTGWLIGYGLAGLSSLTGSVLLLRAARKPPAGGLGS